MANELATQQITSGAFLMGGPGAGPSVLGGLGQTVEGMPDYLSSISNYLTHRGAEKIKAWQRPEPGCNNGVCYTSPPIPGYPKGGTTYTLSASSKAGYIRFYHGSRKVFGLSETRVKTLLDLGMLKPIDAPEEAVPEPAPDELDQPTIDPGDALDLSSLGLDLTVPGGLLPGDMGTEGAKKQAARDVIASQQIGEESELTTQMLIGAGILGAGLIIWKML